jgi:signal transduction histidine kinase
MRRSIILFSILCWSVTASGQAGTVSDHGAADQAIMDSSRVMSMIDRADSLNKVGKIQKSISLLKQAKKTADSLDSAHLMQSVDIFQAQNYLSNSQPDSAAQILTTLLDAQSNPDRKSRINNLLGDAYRYLGQYDKALEKQQRAQALIDSAESPHMYGSISHSIGSIYSKVGNYPSAFKYFLRTIEVAEATSDSLMLANGLNSLGLAYNNNSEYEKARGYFERAIEINRRLNDRVGLLRATNNLAMSQDNLQNYDQAIAGYEQALALHKEIRKDTPPFRILYNMGQLHKRNNKLTKAEEHFRQSLQYCQQVGIPQGIVFNYGGLANVAELRKNFDKARNYYQNALDVAQKIRMVRLEREALQSLYDLEKRQDNYRDALTYHERLTTLSDSLDSIARQQQLDETETKLGLRRQEQINRLLQEKQRQQEARIATQNWLIALGVAIILIILVSLYLLYRSNAEKRRINSELALQRNELQELNQVKDKMLAIIAHDLRSPMASMQGMLYLLQDKNLSKSEIDDLIADLNVTISQNISMMDNLLAWAREQMTGLELNLTTVSPHKIIKEVFSNFELQARDKGIKLINEVSKELEIRADRNLLTLILRNLVSNSIKFSQSEDEIIVRTRQEESGKIVFEVADTGVGIPEDEKENIFSIKGESRMGTQDEKGTGLGLRLCKEFVEKQDGEISVESTEGEGTTFTFALPKAS